MRAAVVVGRGLLVRAGLGHIDTLFEIGSEVVRREERRGGGTVGDWGVGSGTDGSGGATNGGGTMRGDGDEWRG